MKNPLSALFGKHAKPQEDADTKDHAADVAAESHIALHEAAGTDKLIFKDLVLHAADGSTLVNFGDLTLSPGDRMMISGPAGCGKSAMVAAIRGAWLLGGSGDITVPPEVRFVPQEEYFPDRTLRGIICAPDSPSRFTQEEVERAMTDAGLADFIGALDDPEKRGEYWKNTLSGGQKNKLGFAGIFLHAASIKLLIVDEITAALDAKSEAELYPQLLARLKNGIVISIVHHPALAPQHNVFATVANGKATYKKERPAKALPHTPRTPPSTPRKG